MKMVSDWKQAWRWTSMHAMTLALALQGAWLAIPGDLHRLVPTWASYAVTAVLMVAGIIGRLRDQPKRRTPPERPDP